MKKLALFFLFLYFREKQKKFEKLCRDAEQKLIFKYFHQIKSSNSVDFHPGLYLSGTLKPVFIQKQAVEIARQQISLN